MSEQAKHLARQFEQANSQLIALIEHCSHDEWRTIPESEERAVGIIAHHVGSAYIVESDLIKAMMNEDVPALTWDAIHEMNAEHADQHAKPTREQALNLLRRNSQTVIRHISKLDDAQLRRMWDLPFMGEQPVSTQQFIEQAVIDHIHEHCHSMEAVIGEQN